MFLLYHNIDFFHTNNIGKKSIEIVKHMSFRCEREGMEGRYGDQKWRSVCICYVAFNVYM